MPESVVEARASLERLSRPTGFLDGWVMPPRPKRDGAPPAADPLNRQVPLRKLLAGPALLVGGLVLMLLLLLLVLQ